MTTHVDLGQAERARWFSGEVELYASEIRRRSRWVVFKTLLQRLQGEMARHLTAARLRVAIPCSCPRNGWAEAQRDRRTNERRFMVIRNPGWD